jgi:thiamine kinase-like enzyme
VELRIMLHELLDDGGSYYAVLEERELRPHRVYRLRFASEKGTTSLVVKRMEPAIAKRNQLVATRWLPAIGLSRSAPALIGVAAERNGQCVWHAYEDLGGSMLSTEAPDRERVRAAVELIARIHTRFASHPLLPHCRLYGGDLGASFFSANVHDAIRSLEALCPPGIDRASELADIRDRLLTRLYNLAAEQPSRRQALLDLGGPDTLLHGDLWTTNIFIASTTEGVQARLIDWDHAAVGPASYDLSTFLLRFPENDRSWILDAYRTAVAPAGWQLPGVSDLNFLFETAECARYGNSIIWPAVAVLTDHAEWGLNALIEVEQWFQKFRPVLPEASPQWVASAVPR